MRFGRIALIGIPTAGLAVIAVLLLWVHLSGNDQFSAKTIAIGRAVYQQHCASCHGVKLDGQPEWQTPLPTGRLPAPPHDATGHTWHHSDRILFNITRNGTAAVVGGGYESDMRGFGSIISDDEIRAVLVFIKSSWPERERQYQEEMSRRDSRDLPTGKK